MKFTTALLSTLSAGVLLTACSSTGERDAEGSGPHGEVHWLFVQGAQSGRFDGKTLTLEHLAPTVFFSDRPVRIEGHMSTERFISKWEAGSNSFAADPPNAVLSIVSEDEPSMAVVELRRPVLQGSVLTYQVAVHEGKVPEYFGQASLFVDSMGLSGPTLGMGMNSLVPASEEQGRGDLSLPDAYCRGFAPGQVDPLNPNLVGPGSQQGYHFANDEDGPPNMADQLYGE